LLREGHATVTAADSGPNGILALERDPDIDIDLMDIMMPTMDGYATIRKIRAHPQLKSIPIIAVTGKVVTGERGRCLDAGANDYVPKPVTVAELMHAMGPWLRSATQSTA
jgi:two-component system chemotaxis sensor kinase CheA